MGVLSLFARSARNVVFKLEQPQNLLVTKDWTCKVADFGVSTIKPEVTQVMTCVGTPSTFTHRGRGRGRGYLLAIQRIWRRRCVLPGRKTQIGCTEARCIT